MNAAELLSRRVDAAAASDAYRAYSEARRHVLAWLSASKTSASTDASSYWREELSGAEYLLDAHPLVVATLRHHSYHVTGLRPYDYRSGKDKARAWMTAKLAALMERADPSLFVPEHKALGGFGFESEHGLFNLDTLKYFESVIALQDAAVLPRLREASDRPIIWEVGSGWGGFAYVLKKLIPNQTYVMIDLPETMLLAGTYLRTVFPKARMRFFDPSDPAALLDDWEQQDFVFLPHTALEHFRPPRLDLVLNTVSFQEMTTDQVRRYVHAAADGGAPFLYSLNRDRSLYNTELLSTRKLIAERYWPHEIPVLPVPYTRPLEKPKKSKPPKRLAARRVGGRVELAPPDANEYRHVVGWLRGS